MVSILGVALLAAAAVWAASPEQQAVSDFIMDATESEGGRDAALLAGMDRFKDAASFASLAAEAGAPDVCAKLAFEGVKRATGLAQIVRLAEACPESKDAILSAGGRVCKSAGQFVDLADRCSAESAKLKLLVEGIVVAESVNDIVLLAKRSKNLSTRDRILSAGVALCASESDVDFLAKNAATESTKKQLADDFARKAKFKALHGEDD